MACGTIVGDALEFGIAEDELSLVTQSVSVNRKSDRKEARDKCGIVVAAAYYNKMADISIEGLGTYTAVAVGAAITLAMASFTVTGLIFVDEITLDKANEEFVKSSIKATAWECILVDDN